MKLPAHMRNKPQAQYPVKHAVRRWKSCPVCAKNPENGDSVYTRTYATDEPGYCSPACLVKAEAKAKADKVKAEKLRDTFTELGIPNMED